MTELSIRWNYLNRKSG